MGPNTVINNREGQMHFVIQIPFRYYAASNFLLQCILYGTLAELVAYSHFKNEIWILVQKKFLETFLLGTPAA